MEASADTIPEVILYSDGGAEPNPGKGGYGCILECQGHKKELSRGYRQTTNNRMELLGVIVGLETLKRKSRVKVYSDSKYVVNAINEGWLFKWEKNNWHRTHKKIVENSDLWERLLGLLNQHLVKCYWIRGHNGHPENERCDMLAENALMQKKLNVDSGYENREEITLKLTKSQKDRIKEIRDSNKIKAGDPCKKCKAPIVKVKPTNRKFKENQTYYFEYYFLCPSCKSIWHSEKAKKMIKKGMKLNF